MEAVSRGGNREWPTTGPRPIDPRSCANPVVKLVSHCCELEVARRWRRRNRLRLVVQEPTGEAGAAEGDLDTRSGLTCSLGSRERDRRQQDRRPKRTREP